MLRRPRHLWHGYELRSAVVRRMLAWAEHHKTLFDDAWEAFRGRQPFHVTEDRRSHDGTEYRVLTAHPQPAPDELGLILTDFINALRASLDYLVGAMRADGPTSTSAFPLLVKRPDGRRSRAFRRHACRRLNGIPDEAVKLIHWMQPYHGTDQGIRHSFRTLGALEVLWNVSKHRTLLVVTAATSPHYVEREHSGSNAPGVGWRFDLPDRTSEIWLPIQEPPERFVPHFTVRVGLAQPEGFAEDWPSWAEDWELDGLVAHLLRVVRYEIVPAFNRFIPEAPPRQRREAE